MNRLTTLACVTSICLIACPVRAQREDAGERTPPRTITTTGEAVVYVVPDERVP